MQCPVWRHAVRCCSNSRSFRTLRRLPMSLFVAPAPAHARMGPAGSAAGGATCQSGRAGLCSAPRASTAQTSVAAASRRGLWLPEAAPPPQPALQWGRPAQTVHAQRGSQRGIHATAALDLQTSQALRDGEYDASQIQVRSTAVAGACRHCRCAGEVVAHRWVPHARRTADRRSWRGSNPSGSAQGCT